MSGQLWQPCNRRGCKNEPSCLDCEGCQEKHCTCARRTKFENQQMFNNRVLNKLEELGLSGSDFEVIEAPKVE